MEDKADRLAELWSKELDWLDPVTEAIIIRISLLSRHIAQGRRETLVDDGLELGQFKILLALRRLGPPYATSPSHLADDLGLTRGALSNRLAPLEEAGLLSRTNETDDRRRVTVRLTPAGYEAYEQHAKAENRGESRLLAPLTADERLVLADLLRRLVLAADA